MSNLRIFVVDDDADVADALAEVLELNGHEVKVAYDSQQAIDAFQKEDFDLAFMDVMMPGKNGVESFIEIKKFKPDVKVVMMTGYSVQNLLDQAIEEGACGVLHKPVAVGDLLTTLEEMAKRKDRQVTVLIADPEDNFSGSLTPTLEERGYAVRLARSVEEIVATIRKETIDTLILDLDLSMMSGLELYYELKKESCVVPTILLSSEQKPNAEAQAFLEDPKNSGILFKPFDPSLLLNSLARLILARG